MAAASLPHLPVTEVLPALERFLREGRDVVVVSPPGSGKTTLLPLAILRDLADRIPAGQKLLLLEPRRMAARAAAWRMADLLGEDVGETVGYHVRLERRESPRTRILVLTEGLLTRRILSDPMLSDAAMVLFDEFHERSLHADLALALCRDIQREVRPELRLLVLSATLDAEALARTLDGDPGVVTSEGRLFPVETRFAPPPPGQHVAESVARADQRRGRAGRLRPGVCYRLWDKPQDDHLLPAATPEILSADLAPLRLVLADLGVPSADALRWVTPPPAPMLAQSEELLRELGALDATGRITPHGRRMATFPLHPRLAHALLSAADAGADLHEAALVAKSQRRGIPSPRKPWLSPSTTPNPPPLPFVCAASSLRRAPAPK